MDGQCAARLAPKSVVVAVAVEVARHQWFLTMAGWRKGTVRFGSVAQAAQEEGAGLCSAHAARGRKKEQRREREAEAQVRGDA